MNNERNDIVDYYNTHSYYDLDGLGISISYIADAQGA